MQVVFGPAVHRIQNSVKTRQDLCGVLTAFVPFALVLGRAFADIAVSIVAIFFLIECIERRQWGWVRKPWVVVALLLWIYGLSRSLFVPHLDGIRTSLFWVRYIVFAASAATWILPQPKWRLWTARSAMAAVLFLSIDSLVQYIFRFDVIGHPLYDGNRLTSVYKTPTDGITIANLYGAAIFWLLARKQVRDASVLAVLCFLAVFLSGDRMGLVLAVAIMLVWLFFLLRGNRKLWLPVAALGVLMFVALLVFAPARIQRQFESTSHIVEHIWHSPYGLAWKSAIDVGEAHPVFGVGIHQFRYVCPDPRYGPLIDPLSGHPRCYTHPHNAYLEWFAETGAVGLAGYVLLVLVMAAGLVRRVWANAGDPLLWGLATMLAMRLAPFYVSTSFFNNWSAIPFWLFFAWAMTYSPTALRRAAA